MPEREYCKWCEHEAIAGTVCPWSLPCPTCLVAQGQHCRRPSGHRGPFTKMHSARWETAERMDADNGVSYTD